MLELLALALLQFSTIFSSPSQSTQNAGGSSGWGDGNVTTQKAGGSSGWGDGNVTTQSAGGSSGWGDGNL
ncbi:hypothetical protein ACW9KT_04570 [Hymenobacter sp. HD11105]